MHYLICTDFSTWQYPFPWSKNQRRDVREARIMACARRRPCEDETADHCPARPRTQEATLCLLLMMNKAKCLFRWSRKTPEKLT